MFGAIITQCRTAGMGGFLGFDFNALPTIFEAYDIPRSEWRFFLDKMLVLTKVYYHYAKLAEEAASASSKKPTPK